MTIFRSELTLALVAIAIPLSASAQDAPVRGLPPSVRPQSVGVPQPAPSAPQNQPQSQPVSGSVTITSGGGAFPRQATSATPATHTVAQGETLWALAQQYLGDPLLWPEIYRLNTNVVEDPHWIYPGEELRITAEEDTAAAAPAAAQAAAPSTGQSFVVTPTDTGAPTQEPAHPTYVSPANSPTIFSQQAQRTQSEATLQGLSAASYRAVRDGEYYSTGFLTENQPLPTGRIIGDTRTSSTQAGARTAVQLYDDVVVAAPPNDTLQPGNLLLAFRRGDEVGNWGEIVVPTALLRVKGSEEAGHFRATVIRMFGPVSLDQEVLDVQPFELGSSRHAVPVTGGVTGQVIRLRDPHELAQLQHALFIDKGANDGLKPGDLIQIYRTRPDDIHGGSIEQDIARGVVVSTRTSTSTVVIVELRSGDVGPGALVRQIGRIPS
ncbi:MAG: LysM peptidoglycan-binding domain-containing protein [Gemmatimonadales bacterium]